jgi:hypothetical protein
MSDVPGYLSYDPESDQVTFVLQTPERAIAYNPDAKTVSELTGNGWVDFPAHRAEPEAG